MNVVGYKCFNEDLTNRYGYKFEVGKIYFAEGIIKFGEGGNGFHLCKRLEDTLRYFDAMNNRVSICEVIGDGEIVSNYDDYYGYYDMFVVSKLQLIKMLSRDEIIDISLNLDSIRAKRFLSGYKLTKEELLIFKNKFKSDISVQEYIEYYQENKADAFVKRRCNNG